MGLIEGVNQSNFYDDTIGNEENIKLGSSAEVAAYLESICPLPCKGNKALQCGIGCVGDSDYFSHSSSCGYNNNARLQYSISRNIA